MPITKENAAEMSRKGAAARKQKFLERKAKEAEEKKPKTPREMRDDLVRELYKMAMEGGLSATAFSNLLSQINSLVQNDPDSESEEDVQTVGETIGAIANLPPQRRIEIMREWQTRLEREQVALDEFIGLAKQEQEAAREAA